MKETAGNLSLAKKLAAISALVCVLLFFGCSADPDIPAIPKIPETPAMPETPITPETPTIRETKKYIAKLAREISESPNGDSADNPVEVTVDMNLTDYWADLLTTIEAVGKYVALDLSACTMNVTVFDPGTANTGEKKIVSLILPTAAQSIKSGSFYDPTFKNFSALKEISGLNIKSIGNDTFSGCEALATVSFPEATTIGEGAFEECMSLKTVSFPKAISIGNYAFNWCSALATTDFSTVKSIGTMAFGYCSTLTTVSFPEATSIGDDAFQYCDTLGTVNFSQAATIGNAAFYGCSALATADFSNAITIGYWAFADTGSTSLAIKLRAIAPTVGLDIFYEVDVSKTVTVKVPSDVAGYNDEWKTNFKGGNTNITLNIEPL
jgi:hypothetical protein